MIWQTRTIVGILFEPTVTSSTFIQYKKNTRITAPTFEMMQHSGPAHTNLVIYQYHSLINFIATFVRRHRLKNPHFVYGLSDGAILQEIHTQNIPEFISNPKTTITLQQQLGTESTYSVTLERALLLQYKLLALRARHRCIHITTQTAALIESYKHLHNKNDLPTWKSITQVQRDCAELQDHPNMATIFSSVADKNNSTLEDKKRMATGLGLCLLGAEYFYKGTTCRN